MLKKFATHILGKEMKAIRFSVVAIIFNL